jgi:uncharacterized protein YktB (UPF0637 family)
MQRPTLELFDESLQHLLSAKVLDAEVPHIAKQKRKTENESTLSWYLQPNFTSFTVTREQ